MKHNCEIPRAMEKSNWHKGCGFGGRSGQSLSEEVAFDGLKVKENSFTGRTLQVERITYAKPLKQERLWCLRN